MISNTTQVRPDAGKVVST